MRDWHKYTAAVVKSGSDESGSRFLSEFARDYKAKTGKDLCPTCKFESNYPKYLNEMSEEKINSGYVLKKMYEGIPLDAFKSNIRVSNRNLTDEYAEFLLANHGRGEDLFEKMPERKKGQNKDLSLSELRAKYPEIKNRSKEGFLEDLNAILNPK